MVANRRNKKICSEDCVDLAELRPLRLPQVAGPT
jgi:ribosome-associated protein YbcJ (S4-like RNA binding protein)